jgi:hypothetical protein
VSGAGAGDGAGVVDVINACIAIVACVNPFGGCNTAAPDCAMYIMFTFLADVRSVPPPANNTYAV